MYYFQNKHDRLSDPLLVYKYWIGMKILDRVLLYFHLHLCTFGFIFNILGIRPLQSRDAKSRLNLLDPHGILIVTESWTKNNSQTPIFIWNNSIRNKYVKLQFQTKRLSHLLCRDIKKIRKLVLLLLACCGDMNPNPGPDYSHSDWIYKYASSIRKSIFKLRKCQRKLVDTELHFKYLNMYKSLGIIPSGLSIKKDVNTGHMKNSDAKWNE